MNTKKKNESPSLLAKCFNMAAHVHLLNSNMDLAILNNQKAFTLLQKSDLNKGLEQVETYLLQAEIQLQKGRTELAEQSFNTALSLLSDNKLEAKDLQARAYSGLGLVYWTTQNTERALDFHFKALSIRQAFFGENNKEVAASYNDMGLIYSQSEQNTLAIDHFQKALKIYENVYATKHPSQANILNNIAIVQWKAKDFDLALDNLKKAQYIRENLYGSKHPNIAFIYNYIAQIYLDRQQLTYAKLYADKSLDIYVHTYANKHPEIAKTYTLLGRIALKKKNYQKALEYFQESIIANIAGMKDTNTSSDLLLENYWDANVLLQSLLFKAQALEEKYQVKSLKKRDLQEALSALESCDMLIDKIRNSRVNKADKIALANTSSEVYEDAIRISLLLAEVSIEKKKFYEKAFYFSEKNKAAVLLSAISDSQAKSYAKIPDSLLSMEKELRADITYCQQQLATSRSQEDEKKYRDLLFSLNQKYHTLIDTLEKKYPDYYNLKYNVNTVSIIELQRVLDHQTMLISYLIDEKTNRIYIFTIEANDFRVYNLANDPDYQEQLNGLRNAMIFKSKSIYKRLGYNLYKLLLEKVVHKSRSNLLIIPDSRLSTLPFEVLLTGKQGEEYSDMPFLMKKYAIAYDFSATLYYQNNYRKMKVTNRKSQEISAYVCAPVNFSGQMSSLPGTQFEAIQIDSILKANKAVSEVHIFEKVSEKYIKSDQLRKFQYVHFATHGLVNESNPELSCIYLAESTNQEEDGVLYMGEIYNLDLSNAELVLLSACQTGSGKVTKGEGLIGLGRALLYAGAKNLILSFWNVADESTAQLMIGFYQNLFLDKKSPHYSTILRKAKLNLIASDLYSAPYYWAPFIIIGQ